MCFSKPPSARTVAPLVAVDSGDATNNTVLATSSVLRKSPLREEARPPSEKIFFFISSIEQEFLAAIDLTHSSTEINNLARGVQQITRHTSRCPRRARQHSVDSDLAALRELGKSASKRYLAGLRHAVVNHLGGDSESTLARNKDNAAPILHEDEHFLQ